LTHALTPLSQWWLRFADAPLTNLVNQAMDHNTDISIARAALRQA
jgi:outer membrane protein TolC